MFNDISKCKTCKSKLVAGPDVGRTATSKEFTCEISGIPTRICPSGCSGYYWADLDFGVSILDLLGPESEHIAKRRMSFFKTRHLCKRCNTELVNNNQSATFTFDNQPFGATTFLMKITAPALSCPNCHSNYMPAQESSADPYYVDLANVISQTITQNLIYD